MFLISNVFDASLFTRVSVSVPESPGTYDARSVRALVVGWACAVGPNAPTRSIVIAAAMTNFANRIFMIGSSPGAS